ncbi:MAG TPA: hypothetical protein DDW36_03460 [Candidatus Magasanikbacteria bacterium]|nr:hypothetical protein [Candidatus Magasanikbacteria bacterium]
MPRFDQRLYAKEFNNCPVFPGLPARKKCGRYCVIFLFEARSVLWYTGRMKIQELPGSPRAILAYWKKALENNTLHHAYALVGGGRDAQRALIRALLVELGIQTNEHFSSHPDVIVLGQNNEGETERITVDDVRLLKNRFSGYATREQGWRVAVLEQAHTMTHEAANALLKILEEPGKKTLFVLCVQTHELLIPTVRSRCHMVYVTQNFSDVGTAPEEKKERELCTAFINGTRTEQWALLETVFKKKGKDGGPDVEKLLHVWEHTTRVAWRQALSQKQRSEARLRGCLEHMQNMRVDFSHHVNPRLLFEQLVINS